MKPLNSGQYITQDSTQLANKTTFLYFYYDGPIIHYGPSAKSNNGMSTSSYSELHSKIDKIVEFTDSEVVDAYIISSENKPKNIEIEKSIKDRFDFSISTVNGFKALRKSDKLNSKKHTIDIETENIKSIVKESGLSIPDNYVLLSKGKMKAKRFGKGPGSGEEWSEGEVFNFVKIHDGQTIFSDICTIAVRNNEIMLYSIKDHPIQKNGNQRIKGIALNETVTDIDVKNINFELVYEIKGDIIVPVWHVEYKNYVFRYNAVTGENYNGK